MTNSKNQVKRPYYDIVTYNNTEVSHNGQRLTPFNILYYMAQENQQYNTDEPPYKEFSCVVFDLEKHNMTHKYPTKSVNNVVNLIEDGCVLLQTLNDEICKYYSYKNVDVYDGEDGISVTIKDNENKVIEEFTGLKFYLDYCIKSLFPSSEELKENIIYIKPTSGILFPSYEKTLFKTNIVIAFKQKSKLVCFSGPSHSMSMLETNPVNIITRKNRYINSQFTTNFIGSIVNNEKNKFIRFDTDKGQFITSVHAYEHPEWYNSYKMIIDAKIIEDEKIINLTDIRDIEFNSNEPSKIYEFIEITLIKNNEGVVKPYLLMYPLEYNYMDDLGGDYTLEPDKDQPMLVEIKGYHVYEPEEIDRNKHPLPSYFYINRDPESKPIDNNMMEELFQVQIEKIHEFLKKTNNLPKEYLIDIIMGETGSSYGILSRNFMDKFNKRGKNCWSCVSEKQDRFEPLNNQDNEVTSIMDITTESSHNNDIVIDNNPHYPSDEEINSTETYVKDSALLFGLLMPFEFYHYVD